MNTIVLDRDEYPGLRGEFSQVIPLAGITEVSKINPEDSSSYATRIKIKRADVATQFIDFWLDERPIEARASRDRACTAIIAALQARDVQTGHTPPHLRAPAGIGSYKAKPTITDTTPPITSFAESVSASASTQQEQRQQQSDQQSKPMNTNTSSMLATVADDAKSFVKENRNVIYYIVLIFLVDHFLLGGQLRDKLKSIVSNLLNKVEKKVEATNV